MARGPTKRELYALLEERYGKAIADAYLAAIADLQRAAEVRKAIDAIRDNDLSRLLDALHLDGAVYSPVLDQLAAAYGESGRIAADHMPPQDASGARLVIRFNVRNPQAERWLREHSSQFVTRTTADQREAIRIALESGIRRGENPTTTALDIVGRIDKTTGARMGGIVGLTAQQSEHVANAREELASTDPALLKNYLDRRLRDRRFDRTVEKAIRDQTPIPPKAQAGAITNYQNRLLRFRGELIGKHETFAALGAAKHEAFRQAIESGKVAASAVTKAWRHFPNENPRAQHIVMSGKKVGFEDAFVMPDGTRMQYPHDPRAPVSHTAGCHCQADYRIDFLADL